MTNSVLTLALGTLWGQFVAGCLYHFQFRMPHSRPIQDSPPGWEPQPIGIHVPEAGSLCQAATRPASHFLMMNTQP